MNLIRNYRNWRRYRETVSELSRLSNRELSDLGISRSDIPYVARKSAYGFTGRLRPERRTEETRK